jgi:NitT/TauT family transport system substrate-binding protein
MKINIFPTGMRLHEWIAFEEGYFRDQGLEPEVMLDVYLGQMQGWDGGHAGYKQRPQDRPFLEGTPAIGNACAWGSVCNAGAGMGKFVPDAYGIARHAIFVRADSRIHAPEDLRGVPVAVGLMAGSHYNVPYRLERHLPLDDIKIAPVGGFGRRLQALLDGEVEAASLLDPQIYMAEELGLRQVLAGEFNTLWWVDERTDRDVLRRYFTALAEADRALDRDLPRYLPLWVKSIPPEFRDRAWRTQTWGAGERFVFAPYPEARLREVMAAIDRWGMGAQMMVKDLDQLALALA